LQYNPLTAPYSHPIHQQEKEIHVGLLPAKKLIYTQNNGDQQEYGASRNKTIVPCIKTCGADQ
jgi:hypothetical protein